ncbi:MAG: four helix bundle protein [Candidatus Omnitrophica bacterium]|nr:four helix bundle protein [Candidatus Omnitrophota bacterium]MCB9719936.1 four helix bundle protein [Candidatus Omnitrophota bacterium]
MKIFSYAELFAYKRAFDVVRGVYRITKSFPVDEQYGLTSQLRRAAVSVPANIAEGYVQGSKAYINFLRIALGSATEIATLLQISMELEYCSSKDFEEINGINTETIKLLTTYIARLKSY